MFSNFMCLYLTIISRLYLNIDFMKDVLDYLEQFTLFMINITDTHVYCFSFF